MEIASRRIDFADASGVGEARRMAGTLAAKLGFDEVDAGRVSIVASELGANIVKHAGRGAILISPFERDLDAGVEIIALDSGPGIADVSRAFEDGFSTAGTSGAGLGAVRRLSQTCEKSTALRERAWPSSPACLPGGRDAARFRLRPMAGSASQCQAKRPAEMRGA